MFDQCSRCGTAILWLKHKETGKRAPIQVTPPEKVGNILVKGDLYRIATAEEIDKMKSLGRERELYLNHFAECPHAQEFRKPKAETAAAAGSQK